MAYVSPVSSADDLTQRKGSNLVARTNMTSSQINMPFGSYAYEKLGYKKIALVAQDYAYGWESAGGFQYGFEKAGGKISAKIWVPLGAPDWAPFLRQIPKDVDAVYALPIGAGVLQFVKTYGEFGLRGKIPLIGGPDLADEDALKSLGSSAVGLVHVHDYNPANPQTKKFATDFEAAYGAVPSYWGESTYTELMWIDKTLTGYRERTKASEADTIKWVKTQAEEFIKAMRATQLPDAPRGPLSLDDKNNAVLNGYVKRIKLEGGKPVGETIATFENVSQFWTVAPEEFLKQPVFSRTFPK
jgi:branched-chain amino acid transport system substrate-binding protein